MQKIIIYPDSSIELGEELESAGSFAVLDIDKYKKYIIKLEDYEPCFNASSEEMVKYNFSNGPKKGNHLRYSVFSDFYNLQYFIYNRERLKSKIKEQSNVMELKVFQSIRIIDIPEDLFKEKDMYEQYDF